MSQQDPPVSAFRERAPDVRDYVRPIWQRKWLILAIVVLATAGTYLLASRQRTADERNKQFAASTEVYIQVANPADLVNANGAAVPPDGQQMSDIATLFTAQPITNAAYRTLGMPVGSAGTVNVGLLATGSAATYGTNIIVVQATTTSAPLAARLANAYVAQWLASRKRSEAAAATSQANATRAQFDSLPRTSVNASERRTLALQIAQLRATAVNPSGGAYQVSPAAVPLTALPLGGHGPIFDAAIAAVVALLLGIAVAFALSFFDRRILRVSSVESSYHRTVLAVLPHVSKPERKVDGHTIVPRAFVEPLRSLRVNLRLLRDGAPPRTVVVTSAVPGEGKSTVAAHLALVCAESGERVLLVDADLRRPIISKWFGIEARAGLTQVLRGEVPLADAIVTVYRPQGAPASSNGTQHAAASVDPRLRGGLDVLLHGDVVDNPGPLLASQTMATTLAAVSKRYDVVVVDTAPILAVADAVPMLGGVDAVLFVARLGVTTRDAAERLAELATRVPHANVVGVVANDVRDTSIDGGYYGAAYSDRRSGYSHGNGSNGGGSRHRGGARTQ